MSTLSPDEATIQQLYLSGLSTLDIGIELSMPQSSVYYVLKRVEVKTGKKVIRQKVRYDSDTLKRGNRHISRLNRAKIPVGTLAITLGGLTASEMKWLSASIPLGMSVAEFITAVIRDAYSEETK